MEQVEKRKITYLESHKLAAGEQMLTQKNGNSSSCDADAVGARNGHSQDHSEEWRRYKRRRKTPAPASMNDGFASFGESMRDMELAKVDLEAKRLSFEEKRHNDLMRDRAEQRAQEVADRDARNNADMNGLQAMLVFATKAIKIASKN